ncbi:MAG: OmpA family protein [Pseudomonadota bacterium]
MDKMGMATGPGKVKEFVVDQSSALIWDAVLYNYNIDGNLLKDEHKDYIKQKLHPILSKGSSHVKIFGRASKSGDADYNQALSAERALRVKDHLLSLGLSEAQVPGQEMRAQGEYLSTSQNEEDSFDRAVILRIGHGQKTEPIKLPKITVPVTIVIEKKKPVPPNTTPPKPQGGTKFKIKHLGTASYGIGAGHIFWIVDETTNEETTIILSGPSVSEGVAPVTGKGTWVPFNTNKPTSLHDFVGTARFVESPGVLWWSATDNFLTFDKVETGGPIRIKSGVTIGATGGAITTGPTVMLEEPNPYVPRYTYDPISGDWVLD